MRRNCHFLVHDCRVPEEAEIIGKRSEENPVWRKPPGTGIDSALEVLGMPE